MIKYIPEVTLKTNKERKPKWMKKKIKRCFQGKYAITQSKKYTFSRRSTPIWNTKP